MFFLKQCSNVIINQLKHIINLSFQTGTFPSQCKVAKIVPIYKSGDPRIADNYRPIALLCNFSKIIEKVMCKRLTNYLETNNLISNCQFGFRSNHSTLHPLMHLSNFITKSFNEKKTAVGIFCDLRKAFDTVNHEILFKKLSNIGVKDTELNWFKSYLKDRKQYVHVNGVNSSILEIILGVPQGSILGPLLFLIYINDLPDCTTIKSLLFADDLTLLDAHTYTKILFSNLNTEFKKVTDYFKRNRLSIHPLKTKYIVFTTNRNLDIGNEQLFINDNLNNDLPTNNDLLRPLDRITGDSDNPAIKYLGVYIDPKFKFIYHAQLIHKKLSSALYFMRSAKNILNAKSLISVYYSLFHSHLIYAIQIWNITNNSMINSLYKLQKNSN